jgi:hypothetical protein
MAGACDLMDGMSWGSGLDNLQVSGKEVALALLLCNDAL